MQVLDHEEDQADLREALEQAEDRLEQPGLKPLALGRRLGLLEPGEGRQESTQVGT